MNELAKPLAILALVLTIGPPTWIFLEGVARGAPASESVVVEPGEGADDASARPAGFMTEGVMKTSMGVGAVLWFLAAPKWLREDR